MNISDVTDLTQEHRQARANARLLVTLTFDLLTRK